MRTLSAVALVALLGTSAVFAPSLRAQDNAEAIREVTRQINEAWNNHDAEAVAAYFDADWRNFNLVGRQLEAAIAELFESQPKHHRELLNEVGIVNVTSDVAVYMGTREVSGTVDDQGNALEPVRENFSRVYRKSGDSWLAVVSYSVPIQG